MIAYIRGMLAEAGGENLVLEAGQIGYNIRVPANLVHELPPVGTEVKIYTYTSVREDAIQLFGFLHRDDLDMFRQLITVNGIGPKGGLAILSVMGADEIRLAILSQDAKALSRAPGIGARTAQRVILELKDKISLEDTLLARESAAYAQGQAVPGGMDEARKEAVEALTALGYSGQEALRAVQKAAEEREDMDVEALLKAALKHMF